MILSPCFNPLFYCTISFLAGIAILYSPTSTLLFLSVFFVCITILIFVSYNNLAKTKRTVLLSLVGITAGFFWGTYKKERYTAAVEEIINQPEQGALILCIRDVEESSQGWNKHQITAEIIRCTNNPRSTWGYLITCNIHQKTDVLPGDLVTFDKKIKKAKGDFQFYQQRKEIIGTGFFNASPLTLIHRPKYHIGRLLWRARSHIWNKIRSLLSPKTSSLYEAMFGGKKMDHSKYSKDIRQEFRAWGVSHYLARSGIHVTLFIAILGALLIFIPMPLLLKQLFTLFILLLYTLLTWTSLSFYRALLMFCFLQSMHLAQKQTTSLQTISFVALLGMLYNPFIATGLEFQLSFGCSLALILFTQNKKQLSSVA